MNSFMIKRLVAKDWYFNRYIMLGYLLGGMIAMGIMFSGGTARFTIGSILLVTAIISLACHLVMGTVVQERERQTLPFIMSLPVSIKDYTIAKLTANVTVYLVPWTLLSGFLIWMMASWPSDRVTAKVAILRNKVNTYAIAIFVDIKTGFERKTTRQRTKPEH